jgi:hypothetical protein
MAIYKITSTIEFTYEGEFETQADAEKFAGNYDNLQYSQPVDLEIEELEEDEPDYEEDIQDPEDEDDDTDE